MDYDFPETVGNGMEKSSQLLLTPSFFRRVGRKTANQIHIHLYTLCIYNVHLMVNGYFLPIYHIIDKPYDSRSLTIYISIY